METFSVNLKSTEDTKGEVKEKHGSKSIVLDLIASIRIFCNGKAGFFLSNII